MKKAPLAQIEKDYIKLYLADLQRTKGRVVPPDFEVLAEKLNRDVETVKRYASQQPEILQDEPEKPTTPPPKLTHLQKTIRDTIINDTAGKTGNKVAVMSEGASTLIAEQQKISSGGKSKFEKNIYRGNK